MPDLAAASAAIDRALALARGGPPELAAALQEAQAALAAPDAGMPGAPAPAAPPMGARMNEMLRGR